ncbi:PaaI family thioesterase [Salaquimonas pukyongi]|uniref:PaaI family thioesterase n=1 Tax=Salaquimonas pukyongi TaxID=2712698 RepID=UPI00096B9962|nr:PaaI family thioesterase [Salaquimonas pukyongi]
MKPENPDFAETVHESFARQSFMTTLGGTITAVEPGMVCIEYGHHEGLLQQHGFIHAGVGTSILDSACGYAALSLAPAGAEVLTVEFKVNFLRPAKGKRFSASGQVLKAGKRLTVCEGELRADGTSLIAKMQATMSILVKT